MWKARKKWRGEFRNELKWTAKQKRGKRRVHESLAFSFRELFLCSEVRRMFVNWAEGAWYRSLSSAPLLPPPNCLATVISRWTLQTSKKLWSFRSVREINTYRSNAFDLWSNTGFSNKGYCFSIDSLIRITCGHLFLPSPPPPPPFQNHMLVSWDSCKLHDIRGMGSN